MRVDVQDVGVVDFPDDATDEEIQSALNDLFPAQQRGPDLGTQLPIATSGEELAQQRFEAEESLRRSGVLGPPVPRPSFSEEVTSKLSVSPQEVQNAAEVVRANLIAQNLQAMGIDVPREQVLATVAGQREVAPSTAAQVTSGVQNVAAGLVGGLTDPVMAAPIAAAAMFPPLAPAVSAGFGAHMLGQVPQLARTAGEASVAGTPYEKTKAYGDLGASALFIPSLAVHAASPVTRPVIERTPDAVQRQTETVLRNVREPQVTQEGQVQVPERTRSPEAAQALSASEISALSPDKYSEYVKGKDQLADQQRIAAAETVESLQAMADRSRVEAERAGKAVDMENPETMDAFSTAVAKMQFFNETLREKNKLQKGVEPSEKAKEEKPVLDTQLNKLLSDALNRRSDEAVGREILNTMDSEGVSPQSAVERFWTETYPNLTLEIQKRFNQMVEKVTGFKIGEAVSTTQAGERQLAQAHSDMYRPQDAPEKVNQLEGSERGLVALMETANRNYPKASGFFPRQSEALGLGEPSLPPTVETVRAQRAAEARQAEPTTTTFPTESESVQMRKSAERATTSEMIPEPVQEQIKTDPESFYRQQSMRKVEDIVTDMSDTDLVAVPRDSNLYTAAKLEQASRLFKRGENDAGYNVFVELEKEGTRLGQLVNQFKLLKGTRPEEVTRLINKTLEKAGKDPLNPAQEREATETARKSKDADRALDESTKAWEKNPTPENAAKAEADLLKANEAGIELQRFVSKFQPRGTASILKSVLQGNLLTPISEVANLVGNVMFLPFRAASRGVASSMDVINNYLTGKKREITVQPLRGTAEALKGFGRGAKQIPEIFLRGTGDTIKGETRAGLHPIKAWINQFSKKPEMPTTGGKLTLQDRVNLAIEGTLGVPAEAMLRGLGAGDVAFKEAAKSRAIATELELAEVPKENWSFAQKFPELFLDKEALQRIQSDTLQAVFQRSSNTLNVITNWIRGKGEWFDLAIATVAPYKLTPWNIVGEIISYNPLVAFGRAINDSRTGNSRAAKLNAGKFVVGSALTAAGWWLYKNGLISPSLDQRDEAQKARVLAGEVLPPNHINISGLKRALEGGDPAFKPGDETADVFRAGGLAGSMFYMTANIGRDFERMPEVPSSEVWGAILRQSTLEQARFGMNQSFLSGVEGLLSAVREGNADNYIRQWGNTVASISLPNTMTVMSRATREYKPEFREDTFRKQMENIVRTKLGVAGLDDYLPLKRGLWGEPMRETPEGRNAILYHFFDVFKNKQVTSDPVPLELFRLWRKTTDTRVIPSLPERSLTIGGNTYMLNADQHSRYAELVGQSRRQITDAIVINPNFHNLPDEKKIDLLDRVYRSGLQRGKALFWQEVGGTGALKEKPARAGFESGTPQ